MEKKNRFEKMLAQAALFPGVGIITSAGQVGVITISRTSALLGHIFRNAAGHVNPSSIATQSRYIQLFEKVANKAGNVNPNILSSFQRSTTGFQGFSQTFRNGQQIWVQTYNGKIINAVVNIIPK